MKKINIIIVVVGITLIGLAVYFFMKNSLDLAVPVEQVTSTPSEKQLAAIFELDKKHEDTKIYYSDALGVGFTYHLFEGTMDPYPKIFKNDESISLKGVGIEVFDKNPNTSLSDAIKEQFLDLDTESWAKCTVRVTSISPPFPENYISAKLDFPIESFEYYQSRHAGVDETTLGYDYLSYSHKVGYSLCPEYPYAWFIMNKDVPNKFVKMPASNFTESHQPMSGLPNPTHGAGSWKLSVRIVK